MTSKDMLTLFFSMTVWFFAATKIYLFLVKLLLKKIDSFLYESMLNCFHTSVSLMSLWSKILFSLVSQAPSGQPLDLVV